MTIQAPASSLIEGLAARVAAKLRGELAERCVSLRDVAELTGLSRPTLSRRLRGSSALSLDELERICDAYEIDVFDLVSRAAQPPASSRVEFSTERRRQMGLTTT